MVPNILKSCGLIAFVSGLMCAQAPPTMLGPSLFPGNRANTVQVLDSKAGLTNSIPTWSYAVVSPIDGLTYTGVIVGRDPSYHGHRITTIPTLIVPVRFTFSDGTVIDPGAPDACIGSNNVVSLVTNSPIFKNAFYTMNGVDIGATQYVDAFQRANFWGLVAGTPYHTILTFSVTSTLNISINGPANSFGCGKYGTIDINAWDILVQQQIIPSLSPQGVGPTTLPIFLFPNVALCDQTGCAAGYHSAYNSAAVQTYIVAMVDTTGRFGGSDIAVLSHEIAEWMDDPAVSNSAPSWGHTGQVSACQADVEAGDPLTGTLAPSVTMNGFTYHPQELAFFAWFFRLSPSQSAGGFYSNNFTFKQGAGVLCQ